MPKKIQITTYLNKLFPVLGGKLKFSVPDSDLEYLFWQRKNSPVSPDLKLPLAHIRLARIDYLLPVFYVFRVDDRCFIFNILQFVSLTTQSKKTTKKSLISTFCRVLNLKTTVKIIFLKSKTQIGGKSHEIWMLKT